MTPVQTQLIINSPAPVMVQAPDTQALVKTYTEEILPLSKYKIETAEQFIQANLDWNKAKQFSAQIDELFDKPCKLAYQAHKALTSLRESLKAPAVQIAGHVGGEILRYGDEQKRLRKAEEARLQAIEDARVKAEQQALQAIADAERARAEAERAAAVADLQPWEVDEETLPVVPERVVIQVAPAAPVRLASNVPQVLGGPRMVDKPWSAVVTDPVALLKWIIEAPEERLIYVEFCGPQLNRKAKELGADLERIIPGVKAEREQTLKRS